MDNILGGLARTQPRRGIFGGGPHAGDDDLFAASPVPHVVVAADGTCEVGNAAFSRLLGLSETALAGRAYVDLLSPDERRRIPVPGAPLEQRFSMDDDGDVWAVVSAGSLPWGRRLLSVQDLTARKRTESDLVHAALHDSLTNLPNRRLLHDRLTTALARAARSHETVAVIFLDLDGFKAVNDTHGHQAGDTLLVAIAGHLAAGLRACDTVARLGGDEFVVVCSDLDGEESLGALTWRVQQAVRQPITVRGVSTAVSASLGVAVAGPWARTPAALLRLADVAMYHAKRNPGVPYVLADETLAAAVAQVSWAPNEHSDRRTTQVGSRGNP
jgi:diguanylate cyclase (GGDEF)-like protein